MANAFKTNPYRFHGIAAPIVATGNLLIKFEKGLSTSEQKKLLDLGHDRVPAASEFGSSDMRMESLVQYAGAVVLDHIGVAVLRSDEFNNQQRSKLENIRGITHVLPEFYVFSHGAGYFGDNRDDEDPPNAVHEDTEAWTWGIDAIGAGRCTYSGRGIKLAVLDTGFDREHPDFAGRDVKFWSAFGCAGGDVKGHGTHCAGTAAGPQAAQNRMRYGVAPDAELNVYKVLDDSGTGTDGQVLAGLDRAMSDGCDVISMSLGRGAAAGTRSNVVYDAIGQRALEEGRLIIAAAGNSSSRDIGYVAPIDYPANSPTIMAVAAIDSRLGMTNFSCAAPVGSAGIDIAAPGSGVFSSAPMPRKYQRLRGTSMAVPHVAGVACLWAESDPSLRGMTLWEKLTSNAKPLDLDKADVGAGLVYAPVTEP
jgi:subtilisin family serine protease